MDTLLCSHLQIVKSSLHLLVLDAPEADLAAERAAGRRLQPARQTGGTEVVPAAVSQLRLAENASAYRARERRVWLAYEGARVTAERLHGGPARD